MTTTQLLQSTTRPARRTAIIVYIRDDKFGDTLWIDAKHQTAAGWADGNVIKFAGVGTLENVAVTA